MGEAFDSREPGIGLAQYPNGSDVFMRVKLVYTVGDIVREHMHGKDDGNMVIDFHAPPLSPQVTVFITPIFPFYGELDSNKDWENSQEETLPVLHWIAVAAAIPTFDAFPPLLFSYTGVAHTVKVLSAEMVKEATGIKTFNNSSNMLGVDTTGYNETAMMGSPPNESIFDITTIYVGATEYLTECSDTMTLVPFNRGCIDIIGPDAVDEGANMAISPTYLLEEKVRILTKDRCSVAVMGPGAMVEGANMAISTTYFLEEEDPAKMVLKDHSVDIMGPGATTRGGEMAVSRICKLPEEDTVI
jgi:hypothetical protein